MAGVDSPKPEVAREDTISEEEAMGHEGSLAQQKITWAPGLEVVESTLAVLPHRGGGGGGVGGAETESMDSEEVVGDAHVGEDAHSVPDIVHEGEKTDGVGREDAGIKNTRPLEELDAGEGQVFAIQEQPRATRFGTEGGIGGDQGASFEIESSPLHAQVWNSAVLVFVARSLGRQVPAARMFAHFRGWKVSCTPKT